MSLLLLVVFLIINGLAVYYFRMWLLENLDYREARRAEIKTRIQTESRQEQAFNRLAEQADDQAIVELELKFANERHQRAMAYTLQDVFERHA